MFAAIEYLLLAIILFLAAGSLLNLSSHPHWFIRGWDFPRVQIIVIGWLAVLLYFAFRSLAGGSSSFSSWWLLGPAIALTLCHGFRILPYSLIFPKQAKASTRSSQKRSTKRLVLVPGFMSPAWVMIPMQRFLKRYFDHVIRWDYPRVFSNLDTVTRSLSQLLASSNTPTSIVAHSFGDWITRSALAQTRRRNFEHLASVCPVTTAVPVVAWTRPFSAKLASEFAVMADENRASLSIPDHIRIHRTIIWATAEFIVRKKMPLDSRVKQRHVGATHNSILFQPNGWRAIGDALEVA